MGLPQTTKDLASSITIQPNGERLDSNMKHHSKPPRILLTPKISLESWLFNLIS